uniref:Alpha-galactosidase n=2 Tax=Rhodosorus marinus TaxID=101924 RepID=A0A7S2ZFZ0_9RHOD|mmetsp:Transcript_18328/g.73468  ORF Transcript_18328/g.73468 Transcript_18328/m.73468 type:complete len:768 (+) Transcript_18328:286-2589(+)|eukprot:CAMPEP_0113956752 /NCGR_PEP_ID=MMETSP0011_2-20120614/2265_1 /TAXON_ID=101924 /ORGANISM="Rhodosorus marinus" /LENGTH=767 /DNA_ID=CAMNT_0000966991 /DNA_START=119 /DNA_END=2422 /DNA_ORIENTATION=- /assembly_acc=CAM_ASM_000156
MEYGDGLEVGKDGDFEFKNGGCIAKISPRVGRKSRKGSGDLWSVEVESAGFSIPGVGDRNGFRLEFDQARRKFEVACIDNSAIAVRVLDEEEDNKILLCELEFQLGQNDRGDSPDVEVCSACNPCPGPGSDPLGVLINGWQSWSFSGSVKQRQLMPRPATPRFSSKGFHDGAFRKVTTMKGERHSSEMFLLIGKKNSGSILCGFLTQVQYYGAIEVHRFHRRMTIMSRSDASTPKWTDWAVIELFERKPLSPFNRYADWTARAYEVHESFKDIPAGWCSWYHYYNKISYDSVRENLTKLQGIREQLPLKVIQVDDGWQKKWGDWEPNDKFQRGMSTLAREIEQAGFRPGLWLAPFAADKDSELVRKHPEWRALRSNGRLANSGNPGKWFVGLDVSQKAVVEHAANEIRKAVSWGFTYLKLDFLYAGVLYDCDRKDRARSRAQVLRNALEAIREAAGPDVFIVGCGCPLGSAVGLFDAMRIGCDVGPQWYGDLKWDKWNLPSVSTSLRNSITRSWMNQRWWVNDPDCVLLRTTTRLTDDELRTIATVVTLTGGMFMLSDALAEVPAERLRIAKIMWPPFPNHANLIVPHLLEEQSPSVVFTQIENHTGAGFIYAVINWSGATSKKSVTFDDIPNKSSSGQYHCVEFWTSKYYSVQTGKPISVEIPPHGVRLFAVRKMEDSEVRAQYLGSNLHFSCFNEVTYYSSGEDKVELTLNVNQKTDGFVYMSVPWDPKVSGTASTGTKPERQGERIWKIPVAVEPDGSSLVITR